MMGRPVIPIANLTRRLPELGRIKDGVKVPGRGHPKAIDTLRFTSQDPKALAQVAAHLGGEVKPYSDPKSTDTHELTTPVAETPVILPPDPLGGTPMYEMYGGGGRERWCDGITCEQWRKGPDGPEPYEVPCPCAAAGELACRPTVHLSVILGFTRLGGTWRWTTHSHNAAVELPGMVEAIQAMQAKGLTRGVLRVDKRTQVLAGVTRKFVVPVLGVDATADELVAGQASLGSAPAAALPAPVPQIGAGEGAHPPGSRAEQVPEPALSTAPPLPVSSGGGAVDSLPPAAAPGESSGGDAQVPPPALPLDVDRTGGGDVETPVVVADPAPSGANPDGFAEQDPKGFAGANRKARAIAKGALADDKDEAKAQWEGLVWAISGGTVTESKHLTRPQHTELIQRLTELSAGSSLLVETDDPRFLGWTVEAGA